MDEFRVLRDRDAYFVLRGFRYQIDITILQWLELRPNQILELERGEDIDLIARSLHAFPKEFSRHLQQVKHLEASITLRSSPALEAIANLFHHLRTNPGLDLSFAFITNASAGVERSSPFADARPGIAVWEFLRTSLSIDAQAAVDIQAIRTLLLGTRRPSGPCNYFCVTPAENVIGRLALACGPRRGWRSG
jgi:hypothetical protein